MYMKNRLFLLAATLGLLTLNACGSEDTPNEEACPTIDAEMHLAQTKSNPDSLPVMLHIADRKCAVTGPNVFRLYRMNMDGMHAPGAYATQSTMGTPSLPEVSAVRASMPSMGHGTAKAPTLSSERTHEFTIDFQMPGSWQIEVDFVDASTTTTQTAVMDVDVH